MAALILAGRSSGRVAVLAQAGGSCASPANIIVAENCQTGHTDWDIPLDANGVIDNDETIQGFAADISVNKGATVNFKIDTVATSYRIDIYRLGYYGGAGARKVASSNMTQASPQPACISDASTGLVDCGNWSTSASWATTGATSGIYLAKLTRTDIPTTGASHIVFIVRDDDSHADLLFQTSDMTWQAYNRFGGNSLYFGNPAGRAYKVSYNRPFDTRFHDARSWVFNAEYPMLRWLEANGYNVSYTTGIDTEQRGAEILEHKVFMSVGHDEYWSGQQRTNVETARGAGVNLAFFSGNEMFWKTRWENSIDGANTPYRTLVTYKETHANAKIDPSPLWTGTFRDPRFSADGGHPENALTGTLFLVNNQIESRSIVVSPAEGKLRFWRNTAAASLAPNTSLVLPDGTLGYEWDTEADNGFRPAGLIHLSSATYDVPGKLQDFGSTYGAGTVSHHLTLYKFGNARVFGAGTVQWAWGLDANHDFAGTPADPNMKQATVNLFADMGVTAGSLQTGLIAGSASGDTTAPTATIMSPAGAASVEAGGHLMISGTASDAGGGVVAGVEVSVDGGLTWRAAKGTSNWTFDWSPAAAGGATIVSRATDDSGNTGIASASLLVTVTASSCPCSHLWNPATAVPANPDSNDASAIEVGVRFSSDIDGFITGVRFYKIPSNNGTHIGNLWTAGGSLLATGTFTNETASGWQDLRFNAAVPILANTTYVASYHTNVGHYSGDNAYFATSGVNSPPLHAPVSGANGNGVFLPGAGGFPTQSFRATNYWVDVTFAESVIDNGGPSITQMRVNAIDGSTAVVSWKTNEDADSKVDYSTDPSFPTGQTFSVANGSHVLDHSLTVPGLTPNNTYFFRITSLDRSGNPTVQLGPTFTTPGPTLRDTAAVDFLAGSGNTYVAQNADGEVTLAPAAGAEFYGSSLPPGWTGVKWQPPAGSFAVGGGLLTVDGARVGTCDVSQPDCEVGIFGPGHSLEFVATFTGDPFQHAGLGIRFDDKPWAMFSTGGGAELKVRTLSESAAELATPLGTNLLGAPHRFRIDWAANSVTYFVDGVQVASHAASIAGPMRPIAASDFNPLGGDVVVDWMRALPYSTSGTFESRVFDAGSAVDWATILWKAVTPAGTSLAIFERTGDTATPGTTWTNFAPVTVQGEFTRHPHARYVQYRAVLATSNASVTPELQDIIISTAHAPVAVNDNAATNINVSKTFSGNPLNATSLMFNDTDADTLPPSAPNPLRVVAVSAPAHGVATINPTTGAVIYTPQTGYIGPDSFTYTITDGLLTSNAATVSITVGNTPPVATNDGSPQAPAYVVNEDGVLSVAAANRVTANDSDPDAGDSVTAVLVADATHGHVTLNADGSFTYTPNPDTNGPDSFSYQDRDSFGALSNVATVYIGVTPVNDAPSFTRGANQIVVGQAGAQSVPGWAAAISAGPADEAGQALNFIVSNNNNPLFAVQPALSAGGTLTFTPGANVMGVATVTVQLHDNGGTVNGVDTSAAQSFTITIAAAPTSTVVASSNNPSLAGVPITLTASVSSAPGTGVPIGSVTFKDGTATIGSAALAAGVASITTSALAAGTHPITAVYGGSNNFNGSTSPALSQVIRASAALNITFTVHAMSDATAKPKVVDTPVANALVKVYTKSDACTNGVIVSNKPKLWGIVYDGLDGPGGSDPGCPVVTLGSYSAQGTTDANGMVTIMVPSTTTDPNTDYVVIGRTDGFDYLQTGVTPDPLYSEKTVRNLVAGTTKSITLHQIRTAKGKVVAGKDLEEFGSYLAIVQPDFMDWNEEQEQYPFVLVAQGDWDVATSIAPPSGFTTDATSMPATVADATTAVQFTLTDVGSDWTETGVTHVINHKGTTRLRTSAVRMFNRRPTKAKADFWAVMANSPATEIPVLHNDVVAPPKTLQVTGVTQPAHGSAAITAGGVSYTPNTDFTGLDTFSYTMTDSAGATSTANVNVRVGVKPTIFISDATVPEGAAGTETPAVFTVTLSGALEIPVTFDYATVDKSALAAVDGVAYGDYAAAKGTMVFEPGQTSKTIAVSIIGDNANEPNETFAVDLSNVINATVSFGHGLGTILNDDPKPTLAAANASVVEGNNAQVTVSVTGEFRDPITVDYATADYTAFAGPDYTASSGTLTFEPGTTSKTVVIPITNDSVVERTKSFIVKLLNVSINAALTNSSAANVTILDDDLPTLSIDDRSIVEGDTATKTLALTVQLSDVVSVPVTVNYATADGTATVAGNDYQAASGTLTFDPGATSKQIVVTIVGDTAGELSETFFVDLSSPVNAALGQARGTVTITNDDTSTQVTTTGADFLAGARDSGAYVSQTADGELTLAPILGAEFNDAALPAGWSLNPLAAGGTAVVANGVIAVNGAALLAPTTYGSGRSFEFGATFSAPNQAVGFGVTGALVAPMAMFITKADGQLYARTMGAKTAETVIPGSWFGAQHKFLINWNTGNAQYFVDGTQVAQHASMAWGATMMKPVVVDSVAGDGAISVDWVRLTPYTTTGNFTSAVFDAGSSVAWKRLAASASIPTGAQVYIFYRMGETPVPDASWTPLTGILGSAAPIAGWGRYFQFTIQMQASTAGKAPVVNDVTATYQKE